MINQKTGGVFYVRMGLVLTALLFLGFIPFVNARYTDGGSLSPLLMSHAILYFLWYVLYTYQASLIGVKNIKRHMKLGKYSAALAIAMVITGIMLIKLSHETASSSATPFPPEQFILLPMWDVALFTLFYSLGIKNRKTGENHKHYILLAGIAMIDPATARIAMTLGVPPIGILFHFGLVAAVIVYDKRVMGYIHKATKLALIMIAIRYLTVFVVGPTQAWSDILHSVLG